MVFTLRSATLRALFVGALLASAACSDAPGPLAPPEPPLPPVMPPSGVAALECTADVRAGRLSCGAPAVPEGVSAAILGGQDVYVRLTSTNIAYDSVAQVFGADVTVQNLLLQRMGTADGTTVSGIRVFFNTGPSATSGSGTVSVRDPDGTDIFLESAQPFFSYPVVLASQAVSAPKRWTWNVPKSVKSFAFTVYVDAPLLPVIVFDRLSGGNRDLWRVALDGSDLVRMTTHASDDLDAAVSRDRVAFMSYRDGNADLYSMPLKGGEVTRLTATAGATETSPALSRDGKRLAYISDVTLGVAKLWTAKMDSVSATAARATVGFGFDGSLESGPAWSPADSTRLLFTASAYGTADLFDLRRGGSPTLLESSTRADVEPAWSPDGRKVAFASNRSPGNDTDLYLRDLSTGTVTRLTTRTGIDAHPSWTPDGWIVYVAYEGSTPALRWLDPASPATTYAIPTGTGPALRPVVVPF